MPNLPYETVLVLGARVMPDGSASPTFARRVRAAVALFHEGHAQVLLISGRGSGPRTEAEVGAELALSLGIPPERLAVEAAASRTADNARFTAPMVRGQRVAVVTCDWHAPRARLWFARYHPQVEVLGVPSPARSWVRQAPREWVKWVWQRVEPWTPDPG